MAEISRFTIFHRPPPSKTKRDEESLALMPLLVGLEKFMALDDVTFGEDPPDFVFQIAGKLIGAELTDLNPKPFKSGGYRQKGSFKKWKDETDANPKPSHEFRWEEFSMRESLESFRVQLDRKSGDALSWKKSFVEAWLLARISSGGPFAPVVAKHRADTPGRESEVADYVAKATYCFNAICQSSTAFRCVILFSDTEFLAFPISDSNSYQFPIPSAGLLNRGQSASDRFLDWRISATHFVEHREE